MYNKIMNEIELLKSKTGADSIEKEPFNWEGYEVYSPVYQGEASVSGYKEYILVKGEEVKVLSPEEAACYAW